MIKLAGVGGKPEARNIFTVFIKAWPNSTLRKDADQALTLTSP